VSIVAEFYAGPKDGEVRALPALLPSWEVWGFSPLNAVFNGGSDPSRFAIVYDLVKDENDEPVKSEDGTYKYEYRRPE